MKRLLSLGVVVLILAALSGCGKKQEAEELQPITMESLSAPVSAIEALPELKGAETKVLPLSAAIESKEVVPLPPQGPYKPTNIAIQNALQKAGFYSGKIDGNIGPKSKRAIENFQSANGLKVDGKVGVKTWEALSKYLSAITEPAKR